MACRECGAWRENDPSKLHGGMPQHLIALRQARASYVFAQNESRGYNKFLVLMIFLRMSIIIILCFFLLAVGAWLFTLRGVVKKQASVTIGETILRIEVADTAMARMKGLSGHAPLADDEGMFFVFDAPGNYGFWMKGMTFPIDIVWIRGDKVVSVTENVPIPKSVFDLKTYYPPELVDRILEINAGIVEKYGLRVGDAVLFFQ